jgi:acyl carrier protein
MDRGDGSVTEMTTVEDLVARVFGVERREIDERSSPETVEGWDSMGHLNLVMELERTFQLSIAIADAIEMANVKRIKEILRTYGALRS